MITTMADQVVIQINDEEEVQVIELDTEPVVEILETGVVGPQGPPGEKGDTGEAPSYLHQQPTAASQWTINHNLGFKPSVELLNSASQEIDADVIHTSDNQVLAVFNLPVSGLARLN